MEVVMDCIFCKIINNEIPSYKIYEDNLFIAILDINGDSNGHTLVIPKRHIETIEELNNEELQQLIKISNIIKDKITKTFNSDGFTYIVNSGSRQEIKHFHMHIKPHYKDNVLIPLEEVYSKLK